MSIMDENKALVEQLVINDTGDNGFRPDNVVQKGNAKNRALISGMLDYLLLDGSRIDGKENLIIPLVADKNVNQINPFLRIFAALKYLIFGTSLDEI